MAFIRKVPDAKATGTLRRVHDAARQRAGSVAQIIQVMSLGAKQKPPRKGKWNLHHRGGE